MSSALHSGLPVRAAGEPLERARAAMLLLHGRGATAADILLGAAPLLQPGWAFLAPEAAGDTWYPNPFTAPLADNEPWLSSALALVGGLCERIAAHLPAERTVLLGFSQGACLTLEFAARNARRYGAVVGLSGGLIGPDGTPRDYPGSLVGTPVLLACSDRDPHIPAERVMESGEVLRRLGGDVAVRLYPGMGHEVSMDELELVRGLMAALGRRSSVEEVSR